MAVSKVGLNRIRRKNGYVYQINYTVNGIRKREVVGSNKRQAELYQSTIQRDLIDGKIGIPDSKPKISYQHLYEEFMGLKQNLSPNSRKRYRAYNTGFLYFFKKYFPKVLEDIKLIRTSYIKESIDHLCEYGTAEGKIWKPKTANGYKVFLASLFKYAIKKKYLEENPVTDIPNQKVERKIQYEYFSEQEISEILKEIDPFWKNYFNFILNTGLRRGEIENLRWENVYENERKIMVTSNGEWSTKTTESNRVIRLNDTALQIIRDQRDKHSDYVFTNKEGNRIDSDCAYDELKKVLRKLKYEGDVHKFRHTFASNFMMRGAGTIYELSKILGHKSIETTQIYAHLGEDHMLSSMQKLEKKE